MRLLLGGTFDPIHNGHLRCAWEVAEHFHSPVWLMPAGQPAHREPTTASPGQRVELIRSALQGQSRLLIETCEVESGRPSYTVHTLQALRAQNPDEPLGLIVGADAHALLHTWFQWKELPRLCHLIVVTRPGSPDPAAAPCMTVFSHADSPNALASQGCGLSYTLAITPLDISASRIRAMVSAGDSPRYLVPDQCLAGVEEIYL